MIAIVDYDTGNLRSVADAMRRIGAGFTITSDPAVLRGAERVLLPGVGEASTAMAKLRERGLDAVIPALTKPVLGICIGMQLMCLDSEEGGARCLGIFPAHVRRLGNNTTAAQTANTGAPVAGTRPTPTADATDGTGARTTVCGARSTTPDAAGGSPLKIPHVGWNTIGSLSGPLFGGLDEETYVYYVHSFAAEICGATIARTDYGGAFSAALGRGNFFGTQFHPEKSGSAGERILRNFLKL